MKMIANFNGISTNGLRNITTGKIYENASRSNSISSDDYVYIKDDSGWYDFYPKHYFTEISKLRNEKLNNLLNDE